MAGERCSFALWQASLHTEESMGPSVVLQAAKASCHLPVVPVVPAMSIDPADEWLPLF